MKIASTDLVMRADQSAAARTQQSEKLRTWRDTPSVLTTISEHAWNTLMAALDHAAPPRPAVPPASTFVDAGAAAAVQDTGTAVDNDPFLSLVKRMIEKLTGKEVKVFDMEAFSAGMRHIDIESRQVNESLQAAAGNRAGWGMEYDSHRLHEEFQQTTFSAAGVVRTADGQEIEFRLDLEMTRYYREESHTSLRAGDAVRKDPLVVNFDGTAAQLAEQAGRRFRFDLDGDGQKEDLPLFASGSGYLAMDLNRNGIIDSGKELFGPASGNGFADLGRIDKDVNGWIDENDPRFAELLVWTPAAEGAGELRTLKEAGIGALGLAHVASPFDLRGSDNRDLGSVKSSGIYLTESGKAGALQEIDLTV